MNVTALAWVDFDNSTDHSEIPGRPPSASTFEFVVVGVLLTLVALMGIVANVISLAVFSRPEMRSSVNCCLQGLALFDIGVLVCALFMLGFRTLGKNNTFQLGDYTFKVFPFILPALYPLALIAQTGSIWTTVAVTVERYVAVCHPLRARSFCTHRRATYYNLVVLVLSVAYNVPRFFEVQRVTYRDAATNETLYAVRPSEFRRNRTYFRVYYIGLYLLFMYGLPFAALAFLNCRIWWTVRAANRERRFLSRRLQKDFGLAVMLLCVVVVFIICNVLAPVANVLEYTGSSQVHIVHLSNLLVVTNSAANLIVYCVFGHRFKRLFLYLFCGADPRETTQHSKDILRWTSVRMTTKSSTNSGPLSRIDGSGHNGTRNESQKAPLTTAN